MKKGRLGTMTHGYKRHGTTTLFAALNVLDGTVTGRNMRHRHQEFIWFLNTIEAKVPAGKIIHAVIDNYDTHKHPKVLAWVERHPPTLPQPRAPGSMPWRGSSQNSRSGGSNGERSAPLLTFKPPSTASSPSRIKSPNPSSGPKTQMRSSPQLNAGTKR
jgi:hypothetical protein